MTKFGSVYVSDLKQVRLASANCLVSASICTKMLINWNSICVELHEGITRVNNLNINNEIDNDIHKLLPYPWRSDKDAYLIIQLRHFRPLRHMSLFGSWSMLDSAANLLIHWILRDGGKIETTKTQNDLLYNSSTQHLWLAPGKLPNTRRDFFSKIQRIYTANEWVKILYGLLYQNPNF